MEWHMYSNVNVCSTEDKMNENHSFENNENNVSNSLHCIYIICVYSSI